MTNPVNPYLSRNNFGSTNNISSVGYGDTGVFNFGMPGGGVGSMDTYGLSPEIYGIPQKSFGIPGTNLNASGQAQFAGGSGIGGAKEGSFWDGMLGKDGWGNMALGAAQTLGGAYMGMKQYGLAKKTLEENKKQFQMNYDAQRSTTNAALADRQNARLAGNGGTGFESVASYMDKYGVK